MSLKRRVTIPRGSSGTPVLPDRSRPSAAPLTRSVEWADPLDQPKGRCHRALLARPSVAPRAAGAAVDRQRGPYCAATSISTGRGEGIMSEHQILDFIGGRQETMTDLLRELVVRESGTYDKGDVDALGGFLRERLDALGFETSVLPQVKLGDHIVGRRPGSSGRQILLVGHFDTVFSHGTLAERPWRVENGIAYGPGVYDMKGGISILLTA